MSQRTAARGCAQFRGLFRSLVLDPGLLFAHILSAEIFAKIMLEEMGETRDRIFTPLATLATLLSQILSDDHSCRATQSLARRSRATTMLTGDRRILHSPATLASDAPAPSCSPIWR